MAVLEFFASARLLAEELASVHTSDHLGRTRLELESRGSHSGVLGGGSHRPQGGTAGAVPLWSLKGLRAAEPCASAKGASSRRVGRLCCRQGVLAQLGAQQVEGDGDAGVG